MQILTFIKPRPLVAQWGRLGRCGIGWRGRRDQRSRLYEWKALIDTGCLIPSQGQPEGETESSRNLLDRDCHYREE
jgi:hypothetical protein